MPYVRRNAQGEVVSLHRHAEAGTSEFLPEDHPEVALLVWTRISSACSKT